MESLIIYVIILVLFLSLGGNIGSILKNATLPSIYPPNYLFGLAWSILFLLFIIFLYRVSDTLQWIGIIYFTLVLAWTPLFVNTKSFAVAFYYLLFITFLTILLLVLSKEWILIPQLIWVSFATYLSYELYKLN
jgi:tryptophan-rich sensory protein